MSAAGRPTDLSYLDPINHADTPALAVQLGTAELVLRIEEERRRRQAGLKTAPGLSAMRMTGTTPGVPSPLSLAAERLEVADPEVYDKTCMFGGYWAHLCGGKCWMAAVRLLGSLQASACGCFCTMRLSSLTHCNAQGSVLLGAFDALTWQRFDCRQWRQLSHWPINTALFSSVTAHHQQQTTDQTRRLLLQRPRMSRACTPTQRTQTASSASATCTCRPSSRLSARARLHAASMPPACPAHLAPGFCSTGAQSSEIMPSACQQTLNLHRPVAAGAHGC